MERIEAKELTIAISYIAQQKAKTRHKMLRKDGEYTKVRLTDSVYGELSPDGLTFYLWKTYEDQARSFYTCIPSVFLFEHPSQSAKPLYRVLKQLSWICI